MCLEELHEFEKQGKTAVLAFFASPETRYRRIMRKGRPTDPKIIIEVLEEDRRFVELGIGYVFTLASHMIVNESCSIQKTQQRAIETAYLFTPIALLISAVPSSCMC